MKCRVCYEEIYRKNYKSHLHTVHPANNADDLSPLLTSILKSAAPPVTLKLSKEDLKKTDAKDLILRFFDPAGKEFENIEMIIGS